MAQIYRDSAQSQEATTVNIGGFNLSISDSVIAARLADHFDGKISSGQVLPEKTHEMAMIKKDFENIAATMVRIEGEVLEAQEKTAFLIMSHNLLKVIF